MFVTLLLFFIGFFILVRGAQFLVDGASSLADRWRVSHIVIGLVIAGIGTSIPEFSIAFLAHLIGDQEIGLGTVIGSNIVNLLFILGISSLIVPLRFRASWVHRDLVWNFVSVFAALFFALVSFGGGENMISRGEAVILLLLFAWWLWTAIMKNGEHERAPLRILALPIAWGMIGAGVLGVLVGAQWVVDGAEIIARELGWSQGLIGLTVLGIGTSLPELAVSFIAALKREPGIAIGNIIGSNIVDFLMILGFSALVSPLPFPSALLFDAGVVAFAALFLYGNMFIGERYALKRWEGLALVILYISYILYIVGRG